MGVKKTTGIVVWAVIKFDWMKKLRFSSKFRNRFSEKMMDLGNLAIAALVFGPLLSKDAYSVTIIGSGLILAILCYVISYIIGT